MVTPLSSLAQARSHRHASDRIGEDIYALASPEAFHAPRTVPAERTLEGVGHRFGLDTKPFDKKLEALLTSLSKKDWERGNDFAYAFSKRLAEVLKDYGKPEKPDVPMMSAR